MRWRRKLGSIGCLSDELSDDNAEHADDEGGVGECPERTRALLEDATEDATNLAIPGDVDEDCSMLELSVPGEAVEPLPSPDVAGPTEPPQVLNVTEIVLRFVAAMSLQRRCAM